MLRSFLLRFSLIIFLVKPVSVRLYIFSDYVYNNKNYINIFLHIDYICAFLLLKFETCFTLVKLFCLVLINYLWLSKFK
jgi:hypothetical protein